MALAPKGGMNLQNIGLALSNFADAADMFRGGRGGYGAAANSQLRQMQQQMLLQQQIDQKNAQQSAVASVSGGLDPLKTDAQGNPIVWDSGRQAPTGIVHRLVNESESDPTNPDNIAAGIAANNPALASFKPDPQFEIGMMDPAELRGLRTEAAADQMQSLVRAFPEEVAQQRLKSMFAGPTAHSIPQGGTLAFTDAQGNVVKEIQGGPGKADLVTLSDGATYDLSIPEERELANQARRAGAKEVKTPNTMIQMPGQERSEAKRVGEYYGDMYSGLSNAAALAPSNRAKISRLRSLNTKAGGGDFQPTLTALKSSLVSLGVDPARFDGLPEEEALTAMSGDLALSQVQRTKGSVSNAEMDLFMRMVGSLSQTPAGREKIYEFMDRMEQRQGKVFEQAMQYRKQNGTLEGFEGKLNEYYEANPFYTKEEMASFEQPTPQTGFDVPSQATAAPSGGGLPEVTTDAQWQALPPGTQYIDPTGKSKVKR